MKLWTHTETSESRKPVTLMGAIKSFKGEGTDDRMGRPRRYYQITALGKKAMEYSKDTRNELWSAIPKVSLELKIG